MELSSDVSVGMHAPAEIRQLLVLTNELGCGAGKSHGLNICWKRAASPDEWRCILDSGVSGPVSTLLSTDAILMSSIASGFDDDDSAGAVGT